MSSKRNRKKNTNKNTVTDPQIREQAAGFADGFAESVAEPVSEVVTEPVPEEPVKEEKLSELDLPEVDDAFIDWRNEQSMRGDFSSPVFDPAKEFASADTIVIAVPFWDLSFPSVLKRYLEQVCVSGLTFCYENDLPKGLCRAKKLWYVTTAGGPIYSEDFGYGYVKALAQTFFGIGECRFIKAEGLDMIGADVEGILEAAE